ncbi:MAG: hypothetical protein ACYTEW_22835 [Planctomycetota bacterium]
MIGLEVSKVVCWALIFGYKSGGAPEFKASESGNSDVGRTNPVRLRREGIEEWKPGI